MVEVAFLNSASELMPGGHQMVLCGCQQLAGGNAPGVYLGQHGLNLFGGFWRIDVLCWGWVEANYSVPAVCGKGHDFKIGDSCNLFLMVVEFRILFSCLC